MQKKEEEKKLQWTAQEKQLQSVYLLTTDEDCAVSTDCVSCHFIFAKWKSAHKSSPSVSSSMVLCKLKRPHTLTENCVKLIK